jgi:hypothetical protein
MCLQLVAVSVVHMVDQQQQQLLAEKMVALVAVVAHMMVVLDLGAVAIIWQ